MKKAAVYTSYVIRIIIFFLVAGFLAIALLLYIKGIGSANQLYP